MYDDERDSLDNVLLVFSDALEQDGDVRVKREFFPDQCPVSVHSVNTR